jgi:hypothetical protein
MKVQSVLQSTESFGDRIFWRLFWLPPFFLILSIITFLADSNKASTWLIAYARIEAFREICHFKKRKLSSEVFCNDPFAMAQKSQDGWKATGSKKIWMQLSFSDANGRDTKSEFAPWDYLLPTPISIGQTIKIQYDPSATGQIDLNGHPRATARMARTGIWLSIFFCLFVFIWWKVLRTK